MSLSNLQKFALPVVLAAVPMFMVATGLGAPSAWAETGDLDPAFGSHGRVAPIPDSVGTVWSLERTDAGGISYGGGATVRSGHIFSCDGSSDSFVGRLVGNGDVFDSVRVAGIEARKVLRQEDGGVVGAGRRVSLWRSESSARCYSSSRLAVFRLGSTGVLDAGFGVNGIVEWPDSGSQASSLALEPDGRIVVAGVAPFVLTDLSEIRLHVFRFLSDGSLDLTFGTSGIHVGPAVDLPVSITRTSSGGYRVAAGGPAGGAIIGLTSNGMPDANFGDAGIVGVASAGGESVIVNSLEQLTDGGLLLAGRIGERGFVRRLLANGAPDPAFTADGAAIGTITEVTAIERAGDGKVLFAGTGDTGASIVRLHATGQRDALFGDRGLTWIDLPSDGASSPVIQDLSVDQDGSVIAAGGDLLRPFVVRLLGESGGRSSGVLSLSEGSFYANESDGRAIARVRRSGGSDGDISVSYQTIADGEATESEDFRPASGTLHWPDGDRSEREISIEISADDGPPEALESLHIKLADVQGGAGMGVSAATVSIHPDGAPAGQIQFYDVYGYGPGIAIADEISSAQVWLSRDHYSRGRVCVTVATRAGTAIAGEDFTAISTSQCWEDQDIEPKIVEIQTLEDGLAEEEETFTVTLSNPTGGAILGLQTIATVAIVANVASTPPPPESPPPPVATGGGGPAGPLELLLGLALVFAESRRRRARRAR